MNIARQHDPARSRPTQSRTGAAVDIYVAHTDSEWQIAGRLSALLREHGYTVAQRGMTLTGEREILPADARAVIVIWPLSEALFPKPALEARAAAMRGHLVHICAGKARPQEDYGATPAIPFAAWDYGPAGPEWKTLLRRLRPLCGAPPSPRLDLVATTPPAVIAVTVGAAVAGIVFALGQGWRADMQQQAVPALAPRDAVGADPVKLAVEAPRAAPARAATVQRDDDTGLGGPEEYERDLGVSVGVAPAPAAPPPAPVKREPQGPER